MMAQVTAKPINVAITYRVCQHWRVPMFAKLNSHPNLDVTVLHGTSVPETKLINGEHLEGFRHIEHFTLKRQGHTWVFHPFIFLSLIRLNPDVILSEGGSNFLSNFLVIAYARIFRKPVIWWTLGELQSTKKSSGLRKLYLSLVTLQEKLCQVYLGYSSVALAYFQKMGYPQTHCFRAVNCVDTRKVFRDIESRKIESRELGARINPAGGPIILFVGALTRAKKIDRLLHAFQRVLSKTANVQLVVVGDGVDRSRLEEKAEALGISNNTHFAGSVIDGVSDYFENADIFVLPGLGGLAVSESLAHGVPVICSQGDGCEVDLVRNGQTGFRIESDDDESVIDFIAEKIDMMLNHPETLERMKKASSDIIKNEHNVDSYMANIVDAIEFAATGKRQLPIPQIQE